VGCPILSLADFPKWDIPFRGFVAIALSKDAPALSLPLDEDRDKLRGSSPAAPALPARTGKPLIPKTTGKKT